MPKRTKEFFEMLHKLLDVGLGMLAFWTAYFVKITLMPSYLRGLADDQAYVLVSLMIVVFWYISFSFWGAYDFRKYSFGVAVRKAVKALLAGMLMLIVTLYLLKISEFSRLLLLLFAAFNIAFLVASKGVLFHLNSKRRKSVSSSRRVLIVGTRERAKTVIRSIRENKNRHNISIYGCLETDATLIGTEVMPGIKVIGNIIDLETILRNAIIDEIVFAMPLRKIEHGDKYVTIAEEMGVSVRIIPDWQLHYLLYRPGVARITFENFLGVPTMALHTTPPNEVKLFLKHVFDFLCAATGLLAISPLMLAIAAAIKIVSPGPALYAQERCGMNGRRFKVYKFRTMVIDADKQLEKPKALNEADGPAFKISRDPRIIPYFGTILRKTGLDELPQLFNILRGEMSLVGPRPPIPSEVNEYDTWHRRRLSMKPGITCLWQTQSSRNDVKFEEWMRLDLNYIDNWSLWLDFKILLRTGLVLLFAQGR